MLKTQLLDIDELVLTVRDKVAQAYIFEAINAYRSGAFRAAIISTWIAVVYDIIAKIRELAEQGELEAKEFITNLDAYIVNNNIRKMQELEGQILDKAFQLQFISKHELADLERVKEDRHKCSHPAFITDDLLFQPMPELVRTHIIHSIKYLLQYQPTQGKAAIDRILSDIKKISFPNDIENVHTYISKKYLDRAKESLVTNLIKVLIKIILNEDNEFMGKKQEILYVIVSISRSHSMIYEREMSSKFSKIVENLDDDQLWGIIALLNTDARTWEWLTVPARVKVKTFFEKVIINTIDPPDILYKFQIIDNLHIEELQPLLPILRSKLDSKINDKIIQYSQTRSYANAEYIGNSEILPLLPYCNAQHVIEIIEAIYHNHMYCYAQILGAGKTNEILTKIFDETLQYWDITKDKWVEFMNFMNANGYQQSYQLLLKRIETQMEV